MAMVDAEKKIVGAILIDPSSLYHVYKKLRPEMFKVEFCRDAFNKMLYLYDNGSDINIVSLSKLMEDERYDMPTISAGLADCVTSTENSQVIRACADVVISEYKADCVREVVSKVSLLPKDIDDTIGELLTKLEYIKGSERSRAKHLRDIVDENKGNYFIDGKGKGGIKTGLYKLDDCLGSLEGGDVTVIGARPAVGKSALCTQIISNVAERGFKVGYFNLEMNDSQVYERLVSRYSNISLLRIRRASTFLGGEESQFERANEKLKGYNVVIATGSVSVGEIRSECRHQNFDLIVIDYLQLIKADKNRNGNRVQEVGDISKGIKALSMELKVPIILLSQLNRSSEHTETKEPTMADLRESGDIEQDASNIILLWNVSDDRKFKGLKIEKQRQGELLKEGLVFDGEHMEFSERTGDWKQFMSFVKNIEKGSGTSDDNPFEDW